MKLVSLNRSIDRAKRRERDEVTARLRQDARDFADDIDGYAIVAYRRVGETLESRAAWFVRDALDQYALPEMCRHRIERSIMGSGETDPSDAA